MARMAGTSRGDDGEDVKDGDMAHASNGGLREGTATSRRAVMAAAAAGGAVTVPSLRTRIASRPSRSPQSRRSYGSGLVEDRGGGKGGKATLGRWGAVGRGGAGWRKAVVAGGHVHSLPLHPPALSHRSPPPTKHSAHTTPAPSPTPHPPPHFPTHRMRWAESSLRREPGRGGPEPPSPHRRSPRRPPPRHLPALSPSQGHLRRRGGI